MEVISFDSAVARLRALGFQIRREFKGESGETAEWVKPHSPSLVTISSFGQMQIFTPLGEDSKWIINDPLFAKLLVKKT